jgi:hypothetical protein
VKAYATHGLHQALMLTEAHMQVVDLDQPHTVYRLRERMRRARMNAPASQAYCLVMWV